MKKMDTISAVLSQLTEFVLPYELYLSANLLSYPNYLEIIQNFTKYILNENIDITNSPPLRTLPQLIRIERHQEINSSITLSEFSLPEQYPHIQDSNFYRTCFDKLLTVSYNTKLENKFEWKSFANALQLDSLKDWPDTFTPSSSDFIMYLRRDLGVFLMDESQPHGPNIRDDFGSLMGDTKMVGHFFSLEDLERAKLNLENLIRERRKVQE